jgi:hypothetical protein
MFSLSTRTLAGTACLLLLLLGLASAARAQTATATWQWAARATNSGAAQAGSHAQYVQLDAAANVYLAGFFADTLHLGGRQLDAGNRTDYYVAKYTPAGSLAWLSQLRSTDAGLQLWNLVTDAAGNSYLTGVFYQQLTIDTLTLTDPNPRPAVGQRSSGFVAKLNPQGRVQWALRIGAPANAAAGRTDCTGLAVDAQGNVAISGRYSGAAQLAGQALPTMAATSYWFYTARLGATSTTAPTVQWVHVSGVSSNENWTTIAFDAAGELYAAYAYQGQYSDGGTTLLQVMGRDATALVKYSAAGTVQWVQNAAGPLLNGSSVSVLYYVLAARPTGGVYLMMQCYDDAVRPVGHMQLAAYDAQGRPTWAQPLHQVGNQIFADRFTTDANGYLYLGGVVRGRYQLNGQTVLQNSGTDADAAVLCYTPQGTFAWALRASQGAGSEGFSDLAVRNGTDIYAVGSVGGPAQLGSLALPTTTPNSDLLAGHFAVSVTTATQLATGSLLQLAPNPAHAFAQLTLPAAAAPQDFTLLDALGRPVRQLTVPVGATAARLDVAGLPAGLYVLRGAGASRKLMLE